MFSAPHLAQTFQFVFGLKSAILILICILSQTPIIVPLDQNLTTTKSPPLHSDLISINFSAHNGSRSLFSTFEKLEDEDVHASADKIIRRHGYPVQVHEVTTEDGYILTLHRIPWGRRKRSNSTNFPVLLMHGFLTSADDWLVQPRSNVLPYLLADQEYDVWLGSYRGTTYSRKHKYLDPTELDFWKFSFDEIGNYDIPAMIDYILHVNGHPNMDFVGHSLGASTFFVTMSLHPKYNKKIRRMAALAPSPYLSAHTAWSLLKFIPDSLLLMPFDLLYNGQFPDREDSNLIYRKLRFLGGPLIVYRVFHSLLFQTINDDHDPVTIARTIGHTPSSAAARIGIHLIQLIRTHCFCRFNYGSKINMQKYGTANPPAYKLNKVTVPVYGLYGLNDVVTTPKDVMSTLGELGNCVNINHAEVEKPEFSHPDFLYGKYAKLLVYDRVIQFLNPPSSTRI